MPDAPNVFISWSGPRSKAAAEALKDWLPMILQAARPWMSATDIDKGTRWREEVSVALDAMKAGIICVTHENRTAEWLLFEAGALSKTRDPKTRVWTYLLAGLKPTDLKEPLAMFNATTADKEETRKLLRSINANLDGALPENALDRLFDKLWPDLEEKLANLPAPIAPIPPRRTAEEIAEETLDLLRALADPILEIHSESQTTRRERLTTQQLRAALGSARELAQPVSAIVDSNAWHEALEKGLSGNLTAWLESAAPGTARLHQMGGFTEPPSPKTPEDPPSEKKGKFKL